MANANPELPEDFYHVAIHAPEDCCLGEEMSEAIKLSDIMMSNNDDTPVKVAMLDEVCWDDAQVLSRIENGIKTTLIVIVIITENFVEQKEEIFKFIMLLTNIIKRGEDFQLIPVFTPCKFSREVYNRLPSYITSLWTLVYDPANASSFFSKLSRSLKASKINKRKQRIIQELTKQKYATVLDEKEKDFNHNVEVYKEKTEHEKRMFETKQELRKLKERMQELEIVDKEKHQRQNVLQDVSSQELYFKRSPHGPLITDPQGNQQQMGQFPQMPAPVSRSIQKESEPAPGHDPTGDLHERHSTNNSSREISTHWYLGQLQPITRPGGLVVDSEGPDNTDEKQLQQNAAEHSLPSANENPTSQGDAASLLFSVQETNTNLNTAEATGSPSQPLDEDRESIDDASNMSLAIQERTESFNGTEGSSGEQNQRREMNVQSNSMPSVNLNAENNQFPQMPAPVSRSSQNESEPAPGHDSVGDLHERPSTNNFSLEISTHQYSGQLQPITRPGGLVVDSEAPDNTDEKQLQQNNAEHYLPSANENPASQGDAASLCFPVQETNTNLNTAEATGSPSQPLDEKLESIDDASNIYLAIQERTEPFNGTEGSSEQQNQRGKMYVQSNSMPSVNLNAENSGNYTFHGIAHDSTLSNS